MAGREVTYTVKLNTSDAKTQAAQLSAMFQAELKSIKFEINTDGAKAAGTEIQKTIQQATEAEKQATSAARAAATERGQVARAESQERIQSAKAQSAAQIEEEKRVTAQVKAELQAQAQAAKQQTAQQNTGSKQSGGLNIGGALKGAVAGYLTIQGIRQVAQQATEFAELGTQVRRTEAAFAILSGGTEKAAANLKAITVAGGGAISSLKAMEIADQSLALHLANDAKGFAELTRAGREVALVSPVIHDVQSALTELGLASANQSFRRLDQLGLGVTEVKDKIKELQAANSGLDDSQAFLQASVSLLESKYGKLLDTTAAQASGVERLKVAFTDLWTEVAKGAAGQFVDKAIGNAATGLNDIRGRTNPQDVIDRVPTKIAELQSTHFLDSTAQVGFLKNLEDSLIGVQTAVKNNVPGADELQQRMANLGLAVEHNNFVTNDQIQLLADLTTQYRGLEKAAAAAAQQQKFSPLEQTGAAQAQLDAILKAKQERIDTNLTPIVKLGDNLKDIGIENFFQKIDDGLHNSAELTATANNRLAEYRQQLVSIAQAVGDQNGIATPAQNAQVDAINKTIDGLTEANKLYKDLQDAQAKAAGSDVTRAFDQINRVLAEAKNGVDGFYAGVENGAQEAADKVNYLAEQIAASGQVTPGQQGILDALTAQADTSSLDAITQTLQELNNGAFDAVPGIDAVASSLNSMYDTLAAGGSLTDEQAAQLANLSGGADSTSGSMDALAGVVNALGFDFLNTNTYGAELVNQIINLAIAQGSGAISSEEFAGSMSILTGQILSTAQAAGIATPKLIAMLNALNAVNAASGGGVPGQAGGGIYTGQGPAPGLSPSFVRGQQIAEAAAARAKQQADATDRAKARADAAKAAKEAEAGNKKAANAAQHEFEAAAKATETAFKDVADKLKSALEKVPGLFSASKVTQEDIDIAKGGGKVNYADDFVRRFADLVENKKNQGVSVGDVQAALGKVGIQGSGDPKALLAQLRKSWEDQSLFSNKDNLALINKDAVKDALDLQTKAADGRQNILDYFGASIDAVKEQFKAGDPTIVGAVADELGESQDKNIRDMAEKLKTGGQQMIDKVLELAQASIDKSVAGLDLGDGVSFGGGATTGGVGGISQKIQGVVDDAKSKVQAAASASNFLSGVNLTAASGDVVPITAQITELTLATDIKKPTVTVETQLSVTQTALSGLLTGLTPPGVTIGDVHASADVGATIQSDIADSLALQVDNFKANGSEIMGAIEGGFKGEDKDRGQNTGFGDALFYAVGDGLQARQASFTAQGAQIRTTVAGGFTGSDKDRGQGNPFGDALWHSIGDGIQARQASFTAQGKSVLDTVIGGMSTVSTAADGTVTSSLSTVAESYINDLRNQFGTRAAEVIAIGTTARNQIGIGLNGVAATPEEGGAVQAGPAENFIKMLEGQFKSADFSSLSSIVSSKINGAFAPQKQEVSPGISVFTSAFDFTGMADSATQGLSKAFGTQTDIYLAMGDTAAVFVGNGFSDHDFTGVADNAITQMKNGFDNEVNTAQLVSIGNRIADTVADSFTGRIQSRDLFGGIVAAITASVMNGIADSISGTGATATTGVK